MEYASPRRELVFALVGAAGTDLGRVSLALESALTAVGYSTHVVRLSRLLHQLELGAELPGLRTEDERISQHQDVGDELRSTLKRGDAVACLGIEAIHRIRVVCAGAEAPPLPETAYVLRSLKTRDEVATLRDVYGDALFVIGAYSRREDRVSQLAAAIARSRGDSNRDGWRACAEKLVARDEEDPSRPFGQNVRHTFPEADFFVDASAGSEVEEQISRFVGLIFGAPFVTPNRDEYAMFAAWAAALRSADLSRQVGAALTTREGDVVALGTNEVPSPRGGLYWTDDEGDARDFKLGQNESRALRREAVVQVFAVLQQQQALSDALQKLEASELYDRFRNPLERTSVVQSTDYGRTVHAEIAALLDAGRRGSGTEGCTLCVTTFPCHNCAKHIIAGGVSRVVYIHPYPKSRAFELHRDALSDRAGVDSSRVGIVPFVGVAPRRYIQLFTMPRRKDGEGNTLPVGYRSRTPRGPSSVTEIAQNTLEKAVRRKALDQMQQAGIRFNRPEKGGEGERPETG